MRLLLTNDDGVLAPGMAILARRVALWIDAPADDVREAIIVAPNRNYSGMSSAVGDVFERPTVKYRRHRIAGAESIVTYGLEAPPALCAILGALGRFDFTPDVIVSGINAGANVGRSVLHSGTVGAVLTGAQLGLSGLAVSVQWGEDVHYDTAALVAIEVLDELFSRSVAHLVKSERSEFGDPSTKGRASRSHINRRTHQSCGTEGRWRSTERRG